MIIIKNGRDSTTQRDGSDGVNVSLPRNLGAQNVCAQTFIHLLLMLIMSIPTVVTPNSFSKVQSNPFVNPVTQKRLLMKSMGGGMKSLQNEKRQACLRVDFYLYGFER